MTLRMGDGPVANMPPGLDAYAGYNDLSGIGETWPAVQAIPALHHLSISTVPGNPAMCGDVEKGALTTWAGYSVGYCSVAYAEALIAAYGRPPKLWTAHHNDIPHICNPSCGFGFTGQADGTQWTNHGDAWDESLLADDFFSFLAPPAPIPEDDMPFIAADSVHAYLVANDLSRKVIVPDLAEVTSLERVFPALPANIPGTLASIPLATSTTAAQGPDPT